jgi:EAL domain-containing protein (putative c-di-GMP-specific phosphodiesterase class I)
MGYFLNQATASSTIFFNKLKSAIQLNKIIPQYQPVIKLLEGEVSSFEVLARWTDEHYGAVSPEKFIPVAESSKLIGLLTESIIDQVIIDLPNIKARFPQIKLAINISPSLFKSNQLLQIFLDRADQFGHLYQSLDLEIIESEMLDKEDETTYQIEQLSKMDLSITIDDYGKNYSSLARLVQLPFNRLKIDQHFVKDLGVKKESRIVIKNIIALANDLGIAVIAEGVETSMQLKELLDLGCEYGQGWYFERDVPVSKLMELPKNYDYQI